MAEVATLAVGDPPEVWSDLGFEVDDDCVAVSGVCLHLGAAAPGLSSWMLRTDEASPPTPAHPNGVRAIDHLVLLTPHLDRTIDALSADGIDLRRVREAGNNLRQAFFRLGPVVLEVVGDSDGEQRLWGITFTVDDLDATVAYLGDRVRPPKEAVQPGRRIATLDRSAGSTVPIAFMSPLPPGSGRRNSPHVPESSSQNA